MTIYLDKFCALLGAVKEEKATDDTAVLPYLLDSLLYPFLAGESIRLDSIDYDAFSLDDLDTLFHFVGEMENHHQKTSQKTDKLRKSPPASRPTMAFC